jgi:putative membrane protein insertion efficiency factor
MISRLLQLVVRVYQLFISPFSQGCCRYSPSCSEYAIDALRHHGVIKGCYYTFIRLCKCNPWGGSGFDPVPHVNETTEAPCASCSKPSTK